ncbi:MAG: hypothetical protein ACI4KE_07705 [Anaerovoracaceae bacterium]
MRKRIISLTLIAILVLINCNTAMAATLRTPVINKITNVDNSYVTIKWQEPIYVSGVKVYRATSKTGTYKLIGKTTKREFEDKTVKLGKTYYYKIKAYKKTGSKYIYSKNSTIKYIKFKLNQTVCEHDYKLIDTIESTCFYEGYNCYKCSKCNKYYNETILVKAHIYQPEYMKQIVPESVTVYTYTCNYCNTAYSDEDSAGRCSYTDYMRLQRIYHDRGQTLMEPYRGYSTQSKLYTNYVEKNVLLGYKCINCGLYQ